MSSNDSCVCPQTVPTQVIEATKLTDGTVTAYAVDGSDGLVFDVTAGETIVVEVYDDTNVLVIADRNGHVRLRFFDLAYFTTEANEQPTVVGLEADVEALADEIDTFLAGLPQPRTFILDGAGEARELVRS